MGVRSGKAHPLPHAIEHILGDAISRQPEGVGLSFGGMARQTGLEPTAFWLTDDLFESSPLSHPEKAAERPFLALLIPTTRAKVVARSEHSCQLPFGRAKSPSAWSRSPSSSTLPPAANPSASTSFTSAIIRASNRCSTVRPRTDLFPAPSSKASSMSATATSSLGMTNWNRWRRQALG